MFWWFVEYLKFLCAVGVERDEKLDKNDEEEDDDDDDEDEDDAEREGGGEVIGDVLDGEFDFRFFGFSFDAIFSDLNKCCCCCMS